MSRSERSRRHPGRKRPNRSAHSLSKRAEPTSDQPSIDRPEESGGRENDRFEVRCGCGAVLRGERVAGETTVLCPGCGTELPLLSASPEQILSPPNVDSAVTPADESATAAGAEHRAAEDVSSPDAADVATPAEVHPERLEQRRHWNWLRLGAVAVLLLVVATMYWGWQQRRRQQDLVELQSALGEGQAALDQGEFDRAVDRLARADQAAARLRDTSGQGPHARQLFREAVIWSKLPVTSIDNFFFSHATDAVSKSPRALAAAFDTDMAGRSIIIQGRAISNTEVVAVAHPALGDKQPANAAEPPAIPPPTIVLDWAIVGEGFRVEISSPDLAALSQAADQQLIFGAELQSVERDPRRPGRWLVRLVPGSVVLLTAAGPFAQFNWPDRDAVEALLEHQRELVLPLSRDTGPLEPPPAAPQEEEAAP